MSYIYYPTAPPARAPRFPWAAFLVLSVAFFLTVHWPLTAQRTLDDYNRSQDDIVAEGAGSAVRQVVLVTLCGLAILSLVSRPSDRRLRIDGVPGWLVIGYAAWALMSLCYAPMVRFYELNPLWVFTLPGAAAFYAGATVYSAWQYRRGRGGQWKGRAQDSHG